MNRYDWIKILTRGCPPPRQSNNANNVSTIEAKTEDKVIEETSIDDGKVFDSETPNPDAATNQANNKKFNGKAKEKVAQMLQEEINHFRNVKSICVYGSDILPPIKTFEELEKYGVKNRIIQNLLKENYKEPTPIQMQAWSLLLKRREVLGCAPTGSGKTAAFLLPIIHHLKAPHTKGFRALIIAPTRELARQIVREGDRLAEGTDLKIACIKKSKLTTATSFFRKLDILVSPPQKLVFLLKENAKMQTIFERLQWLIIDESDKLFEGGKCNFRDQLATIIKASSGPDVIRAMFSATLSYEVEEWSKLNLNNVAIVTAGVRNTLPDVNQSLSFCASNAGKVMAIYDILREGYEIPCLIFVQTKERAKQLCSEIILTGRPVRCIHSDMSQTQRDEVVLEFRQKKIWILICTELMGRGIDFKGVNLVINYDFPPSIVSYIHRTGRTGRAGHKGRAITFWSMEDRPLLRSVGHIIKNSGGEVEDWILNLKNATKLDRKNFERNLPNRGNIKDGMTTTPMINSFAKKRKEDWNKEDYQGRSKYAKKSTNATPSDRNKATKNKKRRTEIDGDRGKSLPFKQGKSKYAKKLVKNPLASNRNVVGKIKKKK